MELTEPAAAHSVVSTAGDIMTSPAITVPPDATRTQVADTLTQHKISGVIVVDESGRVVGLVSEHDLLAKSGSSVADLMTKAVISVSVDSTIEDVQHLLVDRRIRRVPVLRDGELVGVVSRGDVVKTMATEWVCSVCGEPVRGQDPPETCPKCGGPGSRFFRQEQPPGT